MGSMCSKSAVKKSRSRRHPSSLSSQPSSHSTPNIPSSSNPGNPATGLQGVPKSQEKTNISDREAHHQGTAVTVRKTVLWSNPISRLVGINTSFLNKNPLTCNKIRYYIGKKYLKICYVSCSYWRSFSPPARRACRPCKYGLTQRSTVDIFIQ